MDLLTDVLIGLLIMALIATFNFILDVLTALLLAAGVFLGVSGALGVLRFPDFFTRLHAASITDTLSAGCILLGLMLQSGLSLVSVKLLFILLFLWVTTPLAGQSLARAALQCGLKPRLAQAPLAKEDAR